MEKVLNHLTGCEIIKSPQSGRVLALIIRKDLQGEKYNFVTPEEFPLQLGVNFYKAGETIKPHRHTAWPRLVEQTQEFVMISEGSAVLSLFDDNQQHLQDIALYAGDAVFLSAGGHGFKILKDTRITEVKLGPYDAGKDKVRFDS